MHDNLAAMNMLGGVLPYGDEFDGVKRCLLCCALGVFGHFGAALDFSFFFLFLTFSFRFFFSLYFITGSFVIGRH